MIPFVRFVVVSLSISFAISAAVAHEPPGGPDFALYDPDPNHLWNRLHRTLFMRGPLDGQYFGHDDFELLYWDQTQHTLRGKPLDAAIAVLDEFLASQPNIAFDDPMKYALLQRDLWALFDWASNRHFQPQREDWGFHARKILLLTRLGRAIKLVALERDVIESLHDNYETAVQSGIYLSSVTSEGYVPFLPPDLLSEESSWVRIIGGGSEVAPSHTAHTGYRALFWVFIRLPGGREATEEYVSALRDFPQPYVIGPDHFFPTIRESRRVNRSKDLPQFPNGTQLALVRQMKLISSQGGIIPMDLAIISTNLTESVQIRVYDEVNPDESSDDPFGFRTRYGSLQRPFEFRLSRSALLRNTAGGLVPIGIKDERFHIFFRHGWDGFERPVQPNTRMAYRENHLKSCVGCHGGIGVHSFSSVHAIIGTPEGGGPRQGLGLDEIPSRKQQANQFGWKTQQYSWGLLQGLLQSQE